MKKTTLLLTLLVGCSTVEDPCDLCGTWYFERFEYAEHITTDCKNTANHFYKNCYLTIDKNSFSKTCYANYTQNETKDTYIVPGEYNSDENAQEFFIKSGNQILETFYKPTQKIIYLLSDGCRFYFKQD